jgi:catechol 2,3-dioxygenase-like lactoylglutathione lyase family enzyme
MDYKIEVVTVPVTDVDRAAAFYTKKAGFTLNVDYHPVGGFRVVQLTPPGSACSIQIGLGLIDAPPGSARATYLAVTDIEAARRELNERDVKVSDIRHKSPVEDWRMRSATSWSQVHRSYPGLPGRSRLQVHGIRLDLQPDLGQDSAVADAAVRQPSCRAPR